MLTRRGFYSLDLPTLYLLILQTAGKDKDKVKKVEILEKENEKKKLELVEKEEQLKEKEVSVV